MIAKATSGASFRGLSNYLEQDEKLEWKESQNLPGFDRNQDIRLMEDCASMSKAEKPVYHLSISYSSEDNPSKEMMMKDGNQVLKKMGLEDHQAVFVAHKDTDHRHLHMMINRVHPEKGRAWNTFGDRYKLRGIVREIEQVRGYEKTNLLNPDRWQDLSNAEYRQLTERGLEKMPLKAKAEFYEFDKIFEQAQGWEDVRKELAEAGCEIKAKGRGGVIEDVATGKQMKLSRVDRKASFGRLEKRFGKFKEFENTLEAHKELTQFFPDQKDVMKDFARFARADKFGSKSLKETTKKAFKETISKSWKVGKAVKSLTSLAASSNPMSGAAKLGLKMAKTITKQINRSQGLGR